MRSLSDAGVMYYALLDEIEKFAMAGAKTGYIR